MYKNHLIDEIKRLVDRLNASIDPVTIVEKYKFVDCNTSNGINIKIVDESTGDKYSMVFVNTNSGEYFVYMGKVLEAIGLTEGYIFSEIPKYFSKILDVCLEYALTPVEDRDTKYAVATTDERHIYMYDKENDFVIVPKDAVKECDFSKIMFKEDEVKKNILLREGNKSFRLFFVYINEGEIELIPTLYD